MRFTTLQPSSHISLFQPIGIGVVDQPSKLLRYIQLNPINSKKNRLSMTDPCICVMGQLSGILKWCIFLSHRKKTTPVLIHFRLGCSRFQKASILGCPIYRNPQIPGLATLLRSRPKAVFSPRGRGPGHGQLVGLPRVGKSL